MTWTCVFPRLSDVPGFAPACEFHYWRISPGRFRSIGHSSEIEADKGAETFTAGPSSERARAGYLSQHCIHTMRRDGNVTGMTRSALCWTLRRPAHRVLFQINAADPCRRSNFSVDECLARLGRVFGSRTQGRQRVGRRNRYPISHVELHSGLNDWGLNWSDLFHVNGSGCAGSSQR